MIVETENLEQEIRRTFSDIGTEKSLFRTIIESLLNGIVVTNLKGHVALVNEAFFRHMGLNPADNPTGEHIGLYVKDECFSKLLMEISQGKHNDIVDVPTCEFSPAQGKFLLARGMPVLGDENECLGVVVAIEDITAMKILDRLKSEYVAKVSHELRSPLSTIHEQITIVLNDMAGEESNDDKLVLARAKEKTSGLISLIGDLLDLSRIEAGVIFQEPKPLNIGELLKSMVDFLGTRAKSRQQSLLLNLPEAPLPSLTIDPMAIESIFGNLITNAINYTNEGGEITVIAETDGKNIVVDVHDNGYGIDPVYHEKIFDKFFRVKNDQTRYITGTGLGLPIVKGLLNDLGGSISLKSAPGKGSVFTVSLPVKKE